MTGRVDVALDVGSELTRIARTGPYAISRPTPVAAELPGFLHRLLAEILEAGELGALLVVVPERWYGGGVEGARALEDLRELVGGLFAGEAVWLGQATAAVAALAGQNGSYLVCDLGAAGLTVARCEVTGRAVYPSESAEYVPGGRVAELPAAIEAVLTGRTPTGVVLSGGFGSASASQLVHDVTGIEPRLLGGNAAVAGALAIAAGEATVAPRQTPVVTVAVHQIRNGLLESHRVPLGTPFARLNDTPLVVRLGLEAALYLEVDGVPGWVGLPLLVPGDYRIGLTPGRSGPGVLVFRPEAAGDCAFLPLPDSVDHSESGYIT